MRESPGRIRREFETIEKMVDIYCRDHHGTVGERCEVCADLVAYAEKRLQKCPFQEDKPTCANCPIHCYKPDRREQIREMMRYSGPRMMLRHPIFAIRHWLDGYKKAPPRGRPARTTQAARSGAGKEE